MKLMLGLRLRQEAAAAVADADHHHLLHHDMIEAGQTVSWKRALSLPLATETLALAGRLARSVTGTPSTSTSRPNDTSSCCSTLMQSSEHYISTRTSMPHREIYRNIQRCCAVQ